MIELKQVGEVAVDSGRIAIVDACRVDGEHEDTGHIHKMECDGGFPVFTFTYEGKEFLAVQLNTELAEASREAKRMWKAKDN